MGAEPHLLLWTYCVACGVLIRTRPMRAVCPPLCCLQSTLDALWKPTPVVMDNGTDNILLQSSPFGGGGGGRHLATPPPWGGGGTVTRCGWGFQGGGIVLCAPKQVRHYSIAISSAVISSTSSACWGDTAFWRSIISTSLLPICHSSHASSSAMRQRKLAHRP